MRTLLRAAALAALLVAPPALLIGALPAADPAGLVFVSGPEPETLDPAVAARVADVRLVSALFEPLVSLDPETLRPRPAAAATFTADARGLKFALEPGLRWSNGDPLVAEDFVAAWRRAADPATGAPFASEAGAVAAGARALDERTIRIEPRSPRPDLLPLLSLPVFAPVHRPSVARFGERFTRPGNLVSNGPYVLAAWEPGRRLRLARNPRYRAAGRVAIGSIEAVTAGGGVAGGDTTAYHIYETGGADLVFSVPPRAAGILREAGRRDLHEREGAGTFFLRFNTTRDPFHDPAVRAAFAAAIDREAICRFVLRGGERPAGTLVPPGFAGYEPPAGQRFDRSIAAAGAAALARGGAPEVHFLYPSSDEAAGRVGEVLQAAWGRLIGARVRLSPAEPKAAFAAVKRLEYDIAYGSWIADYPDPVSFLGIFLGGSGNNRTGWRDPRYDGLLERASRESGTARLATLGEAEARLLGEAPLAPLFRTTVAVLARPRLRGPLAVPFAHLVPWADLKIEEAPP